MSKNICSLALATLRMETYRVSSVVSRHRRRPAMRNVLDFEASQRFNFFSKLLHLIIAQSKRGDSRSNLFCEKFNFYNLRQYRDCRCEIISFHQGSERGPECIACENEMYYKFIYD